MPTVKDQPQNTGSGWTQDESIAFEVARECINDFMGIYYGLDHEESHRSAPDSEKIARYHAKAAALLDERQALRVHDLDGNERLSRLYGERIKNHRAGIALLD